MANILDYLNWRGDLTFEQVPFGKIDALLLAQLSYINFEGLISSELSSATTLETVGEGFVNLADFEERKKLGAMINIQSAELLIRASHCERFKNIKLWKYESIYDEEKAEQFAAITYIIGKTAYVAYRGTDDTIVGWKEDFNIVCLDKIPSRIDADRYLAEVAAEFNGKIGILGHSKGGYLAMYAAAECGKKIQKRICNVFNFDGPGFEEKYLETPEFKGIEPVLMSYYPGCSVVGMIFYHNDNYEIVKSDGFVVNQHDPFAWQICGNEFEHLYDFEDESKFFKSAVNQWVDRLNQKERESMVAALFGTIEATGCKTNTELEANKLAASSKMLQAFTKLDKETKEEVHIIVRVLHEVVKNEIPFLNPLNVRMQDANVKLQEAANQMSERFNDAKKSIEERFADVKLSLDPKKNESKKLNGRKGSSAGSKK